MRKSRDAWLLELESRHANVIQLGLERVEVVALALNLHSFTCPVIAVAGTNGKGSTVSALESVYLAAGYSVGAYTSPHLLDFNERIRLNGQPVSDQSLCQAFEVVELARAHVELTYFEMITLTCLWIFKQHPLDVVILETGLGGRLDAVNIVDSDVAVISGIDFDHQEYLGNTLEHIAFEKAGVMRFGQPVVYADEKPPASLFASAHALACPMIVNNVDFHLKISHDSTMFLFGKYQMDLPVSALHPHAQAAAMATCMLLNDKLPVSATACFAGIQQAKINGRMQWVKGQCDYLFDVAHNAQSVLYLARKLKEQDCKKRYHRVHAVFSALADKDLRTMISLLADIVNDWYPSTLSVARGASRAQLLDAFAGEKLLVKQCYSSPQDAFNTALVHATKDDLIVVYGSFFTVESVMCI